MASFLAILLSESIVLNISPRSLKELHEKWHSRTFNSRNSSELVTIYLCTYDDMVPSLLEETDLIVVEVTTLLDEYVHVAVLFVA